MQRFLFLFFVAAISVSAQKKQPDFHHVEPPFWWIGMKNSSLQVLFHNNSVNISDYKAEVKYDGVVLKATTKVENPHYLFLTFDISPSAKAGKIPVVFTSGKKSFTYNYELKNKSTETNRIRGFNSSDVIYLIMPDRF